MLNPDPSLTAGRQARSAGSRTRDPRRGSGGRLGGRFAGLAADELILVMFVIAALLLGGGGSPSPLPELLLEWIALAALVAALWLAPPERRWPAAALAVTGIVVLLPLLQLVPLPPGVWQALPGRESQVASLALIGQADRWMPWSLAPAHTLASLLALLPFLAALLLAARASARGRSAAIAAVAAVAVAAVLVGAAQLAWGPQSALNFYDTSHGSNLTGFQANRNAAADLLIVGLIALVALHAFRARGRGGESQLLFTVAAALLVGGVVLTSSRTGIALLAAVLAVLTAAWALSLWRAGARRGAGAVLGGTLVAGMMLAWALSANAVAGRIAGRFAETGDPRAELWTDTLYAIGRLWPWGAGFGSFVPVFVAAERLEVVDPSHPNRAHNDYLELALEAGLPGLALAAGLALFLIGRLFRRWRAAVLPEERGQLVFAAAVLAVLAAHSIVDYPLRSMALASIVGIAIGFILSSPEKTGLHRNADRQGTG